MTNPTVADRLIEAGRLHIQKEQWDDLRVIIGRLYDLIPDQVRTTTELRRFTGIV